MGDAASSDRAGATPPVILKHSGSTAFLLCVRVPGEINSSPGTFLLTAEKSVDFGVRDRVDSSLVVAVGKPDTP